MVLNDDFEKIINNGEYQHALKFISENSHDAISKLYYEAVLAAQWDFDHNTAIRLLESAILLVEKQNKFELSLIPKIYLYCSSQYLFTGNHTLAQTMIDKFTLVTDKTSQDAFDKAFFYQVRGRIEMGKGNYKQAKELLLKGTRIFRELGNPFQIAISNIYMSYILGGIEQINYNLKNVEMLSNTGNKRHFMFFLCNLGHVYILNGDYNEARVHNHHALTIAEETSFEQGIANANHCLALIAMEEGKPLEAISRLERAHEIYKRHVGVGYTTSSLISAYRLAGKPEKAISLANSSLDSLNPALLGITQYGWTFIQSILSAIEVNQIELASSYHKKLEKAIGHDESKLGIMVDLSRGLILMQEKKLESFLEARKIFKSVIGQESVWFQAKILAIKNLCHIDLIEYEIFGQEDILIQIEDLVNQLSSIAESQKSIRIRLETGLLQSKVLLLMRQIEGAKTLLQNLLETAEKKNLASFKKIITEELQELNNSFEKWMDLVNSNVSMKQLIEKSKIKNYLTIARKTADLAESGNT